MKIKFPLEVKRGSVSIKIYKTPSHGCDSFTLSYYQDGVRKRPTFSTFEQAKREADIVVGRWRRFSASTSACNASSSATIRRCSDNGGAANRIFSMSLCEMCGTPLLRPGAIAPVKCGERNQRKKYSGKTESLWNSALATRCKSRHGKSSLRTRATLTPVEIIGRSRVIRMSPSSSSNRGNSARRDSGRRTVSFQSSVP